MYNSLYTDLQNGTYSEGQKLPGELALAKQYGVSRNTLRQALAILAEDGLIVRSQGRETLVAPKRAARAEEHVSNPMKRLCRVDIDSFRCRFNYGAPTRIAKDALALDAGDIVLAGECVYLSDKIPVGFSFIQVPITNLNALRVDVSDPSSVEALMTTTLFDAAEERTFTIKLIHAHESEALTLDIAEDSELILLEGLLKSKTPKTLARFKFYFIPEHYDLTFTY